MKSKIIIGISVKLITALTLVSVGCVTDFYNPDISHAYDTNSKVIEADGITYELNTDEYSIVKPDDNDIEQYAVVVSCDENVKSIDLPETVEGYPVREISPIAFRDHKELESISIPDTVRSVGQDAFRGTSLPSTSFVDGWLVERDINYYSYDTNEEFDTLIINEGVKGIAPRLFENSPQIGEIKFPSTLKYIGAMAFENCEKLHFVFLPESVEFIGFWAFHTCVSLKYVTIMNPDCLITYNYNLGAQTFYPNANIYGFKKSTARKYTDHNVLNIINTKSGPVLADLSYKTKYQIWYILGEYKLHQKKNYNDYFPRIYSSTNVMDVIRAKREILSLMEE